jgi:allantoin racemase
MRILVLNANTTEFVTATAVAEGRRVASPGTEIVAVTADFGAAIIGTRAEQAIAEHAAVVLGARHAPGCDAEVIAVSYDTGLKALREMLPIPVVGMTEAALLTACMLGGPIGLISLGRRVWPMYRELIDAYGFTGRVAGSQVLENSSAYRPGDTEALDAELVTAAQQLIAQDGAETIVVLGAVTAGAARRIEDRVPVPVLDGMRCAIPQAELLARLGVRKPTAGSYAAAGERLTRGLDPALAAMLGAKNCDKI